MSEHKKQYKRKYTQILENLRNAIVVFFGLRNEFVNIQGNKKRNTQNIQVKKQEKNNHLNCSLWTNQKGLRVDYSAMANDHNKPKSQDNWGCY